MKLSDLELAQLTKSVEGGCIRVRGYGTKIVSKDTVERAYQLGAAFFLSVAVLLWSFLMFSQVQAVWAESLNAGLTVTYNDITHTAMIDKVLTIIEGNVGGFFMIVCTLSGLLCLFFSFGMSRKWRYATAAGLFLAAMGLFVLRSLIGTFFDDSGIRA